MAKKVLKNISKAILVGAVASAASTGVLGGTLATIGLAAANGALEGAISNSILNFFG